MTYVDGFVAAVPNENKEKFEAYPPTNLGKIVHNRRI